MDHYQQIVHNVQLVVIDNYHQIMNVFVMELIMMMVVKQSIVNVNKIKYRLLECHHSCTICNDSHLDN